jgi:endonuclease YncB( thermonuclease family)
MLPKRFHFLLLAIVLASLVVASAATAPAGWTLLENCRLENHDYADGDSFHVIHRGRNLQFRLYFVDCPETEMRFPERIAEQGKVFALGSEGVVAAGHRAHAFTDEMLSRLFNVLTKWEEAQGASAQELFYTVVLLGNQNLAEELVRHGFARAFGMHTDYPTQAGGRQLVAKLKRLQQEASRMKLGAFGGSTEAPQVRAFVDQQDALSDAIFRAVSPEKALSPPDMIQVKNS